MRGSGLVKWAAVATLAVFAALQIGCSKTDVRNETVGSVDGDDVKVYELREFLGMRGGVVPAAGVPAERKKEALGRLLSGRQLAREARAMGLDNSAAFRSAIEQNEQGILIGALLRKEIAARVKVKESDIAAESKKARAADNALSESDASFRAARVISDREISKIEEDLVAAAKKEFPPSIDAKQIERIGRGEAVRDNAVLATCAGGSVTYAQVRKALEGLSRSQHGGQDLSRNPQALEKVTDREATGRALAAYARKQGIEGSEWLKVGRAEMERAVLANLMIEMVGAGVGPVTEKEISAAYAEHGDMLVRDGKKIPLAQVKEQLRSYLADVKRRKVIEEHVESLKKKGKITVNEKLLPNV